MRQLDILRLSWIFGVSNGSPFGCDPFSAELNIGNLTMDRLIALAHSKLLRQAHSYFFRSPGYTCINPCRLLHAMRANADDRVRYSRGAVLAACYV